MPTVAAPVFAGKGECIAKYFQEVELWTRVTTLDPTKRASALVLQTHPVPRGVCIARGNEQLSDRDNAAKVLDVLRDYFAPEPGAALYREVVRFLHF